MDSHASHVGMEVLEFARKNDIFIVTFPSHCSHLLQPLDVSVYKSLKTAWAAELDRFKRENPTGAPSRMDFCSLFAPSYYTAFTPMKIMNGFRKAGIYPLCRNAVSSEALAPSRINSGNISAAEPILSNSNNVQEIDRVLPLPKVSVNPKTPRRDPTAKILISLPEGKQRGRPKKNTTDFQKRIPDMPSTSKCDSNDTLLGECSGSYSKDVSLRNGADWIQCGFCSDWFHEDCVALHNSPQFVCKNCEKSLEINSDNDSD